ncbi:hypothetical protein BKI52_03030 [marine bacterium AO1-C]|nr:hypothetical protein BKI52_03030 [marine bacterium AO1-C]
MDTNQQFLLLEETLADNEFQGMLEYEVTEYLLTNEIAEDFLSVQFGRYIQYYCLSDRLIKLVLDKMRLVIKIYVKYHDRSNYEVYDCRLKIAFCEIGAFYDQHWMSNFLVDQQKQLIGIGWEEPWFSFLLEMGNYKQVECVVGDQNFLNLPETVLFNISQDFILSKGKIYHQFGEVLNNTFRRVLSFKSFKNNISLTWLSEQLLAASAFKKIKLPNNYYFEGPLIEAVSFTQPTSGTDSLSYSQGQEKSIDYTPPKHPISMAYNSYLVKLIEKYFQVTLTENQKGTPKQVFSLLAAQSDPKLVNRLLQDLNEKFN